MIPVCPCFEWWVSEFLLIEVFFELRKMCITALRTCGTTLLLLFVFEIFGCECPRTGKITMKYWRAFWLGVDLQGMCPLHLDCVGCKLGDMSEQRERCDMLFVFRAPKKF